MSTKPHDVLGELIGMRVGEGETVDDIAARYAHEKLRWAAELKVRGYYTQELQRLEDEAADVPDAEKEERVRAWVVAMVEAYRQMPPRPLWKRLLNVV